MNWRWIRFSGVGVLNTVVGLLVIWGIRAFVSDNDVLANAAGYGSGLLVSFVLNRSWTFACHSGALAVFGRFLGAFAVSYALNLATVLVCLKGLGINAYAAHLFGIPPYALAFYWLCKTMVFRATDPQLSHEEDSRRS